MTQNMIDQLYGASQAMGLACGRAMERLDPSAAPACGQIGTGQATFCGDGSPLTQVAWLGYKAELGNRDLAEVEEFYRGRATNWEYVLNPYCAPALLSEAVARGWSNVQYENVMALDLLRYEPAPADDAVQVHVVTDNTKETWADVSERAFFGDQVPDTCKNLRDLISTIEGTIGFLVTLDGQPAAGASLMVSGSTCYLGGAATLPEFRGRGAQGALLSFRLRHAASLGCDLAMCECLPGSQSQRNQERAGFQVVHTKIVLTRP